jgi:hypothetical protein
MAATCVADHISEWWKIWWAEKVSGEYIVGMSTTDELKDIGKRKDYWQMISNREVTQLAHRYKRVKKVGVGKGSESLTNNIETYQHEEAEILLSFNSYFNYYYYIYL